MLNSETLRKLEEEAREWIGTPYMHMQKEKGCGADCALFLAKIYENIGVLNFVENLYYSRNWMVTGIQELMVEGFERHFQQYLNEPYFYEKIVISENGGFENFDFQKGDVICMTSKGSVVCHHAGMYHENNNFFHAYQNKGVCLAQFNHVWRKRSKYVFRLHEK